MRRPSRRPHGAGPVASGAVVLLALLVGAFLSSFVYRWTDDRSAGPPPARGAPAAAVPAVDRARIRVEVLNGTSVPGLADRLTDLLRGRGFDVVNYGNASQNDVPRTEILDRIGSGAGAREVALALPGTPIRTDLAPDGFVDVTVVVGADHARLFESRDAGKSERGALQRARERLRQLGG